MGQRFEHTPDRTPRDVFVSVSLTDSVSQVKIILKLDVHTFLYRSTIPSSSTYIQYSIVIRSLQYSSSVLIRLRLSSIRFSYDTLPLLIEKGPSKIKERECVFINQSLSMSAYMSVCTYMCMYLCVSTCMCIIISQSSPHRPRSI